MLYVILLKQNPLIKKSLLAGFLFWSQAGKVNSTSLVADGFTGRFPDDVSIQSLYIYNNCIKQKGE